MSSKPSGVIEVTCLSLAAGVTVLGYLLWGEEGAIASSVGAILACLNIGVIRRLATKAVSRASAGDNTSASWLVAAMGGKMIVLFAMIWVALRVFHLALAPFAVGISILPLSLVLAGLVWGSTAGEEGRA
jgi:hypothetical protein